LSHIEWTFSSSSLQTLAAASWNHVALGLICGNWNGFKSSGSANCQGKHCQKAGDPCRTPWPCLLPIVAPRSHLLPSPFSFSHIMLRYLYATLWCWYPTHKQTYQMSLSEQHWLYNSLDALTQSQSDNQSIMIVIQWPELWAW